MKPPTRDAIAAAIAAHEPDEIPALPGRCNDRLAPVLLPLALRKGRWLLWVTQRTQALTEHAGELCFPGGRPEARDVDLRATALREAQEELGVQDALVLGELTRIPLYTSEYRLVPFVAVVGAAPPRANPREVAAVLQLDVADELAREEIASIAFELDTFSGLVPVFHPQRLDGSPQPAAMFGASAFSCYELLVILAPLYGREAPRLVPGLDWEAVTATIRDT